MYGSRATPLQPVHLVMAAITDHRRHGWSRCPGAGDDHAGTGSDGGANGSRPERVRDPGVRPIGLPSFAAPADGGTRSAGGWSAGCRRRAGRRGGCHPAADHRRRGPRVRGRDRGRREGRCRCRRSPTAPGQALNSSAGRPGAAGPGSGADGLQSELHGVHDRQGIRHPIAAGERVAHRLLHRTSRVILSILPVNRVSAPMPMPVATGV